MIETIRLLNNSILRLLTSKRGQTLVEYAIILALISVVAISVLMALGTQVKGVFTTVSSQIAIAGSGGPPPPPPPRGG
jgi:Flp pilus assembly pilin Flp